MTNQEIEKSGSESVARDFIAAMNTHDVEALTRLLADDVTWTFLGDFEFSGTHEGRNAVFADFMGVAGALFEPPAQPPLEIRTVVAQNGTVAVEFTARMETKIGRDYENHYVMMLEVADGQVQHVREYNDTLYLRKACYA